MWRATLFALVVVGCSTPTRAQESRKAAAAAHVPAQPSALSNPRAGDAGPSSTGFVLEGGVIFGVGKQNLLIDSGRVLAVGVDRSAATRVVNVSGRYIVPGFIDSHVHLAYFAEGADELASNGIVAVLDLGAPIRALSVVHAPLRVLNAGPMITAVAGYPLNSWGVDGYGIGVNTPAAGAAAVESLFKAGVRAIKVPLTPAPTLDDATVQAVVKAAHAHQLKVYSHALDERNAARAAANDIDVLAHTPTEPLSEATLEAWKTRTVISTLSAFGGGSAALGNLRALRERGARVLYGTDFGNTRETTIQSSEITQLMSAGMDGESIVRAGTSLPAEFLGLADLGSLQVGKRASFLVLALDPRSDPHTLSQPLAVYVDGELVSAGL